ncbi:hypothetical protein COT97_04850 [Candidatus Falkowbacteria bacterium CG10_big_fil_rev_8_21_14_0_10_39_11]|uniref:Uncharacterized protein n=1 Tax=Candidatus Falkowbacteria bacterium CG10_big_fil_rev_8_21_14_0_10_39_11 TaxID=1974565 RepID=A0A2H0V3U4_9BACT|nr:MAG: hypothetical protein COT97_04850 [Candidatus Falkowbacteria bacterium CG10_big_fil_rev_8_21_14_0_10_39_11]
MGLFEKSVRIIFSAVIFSVILQVVHAIGSFVAMDLYDYPGVKNFWFGFWVPDGNVLPLKFYFYSIIFSLVTGLVLSLIFLYIRPAIMATGFLKQGLVYGLILFLVSDVTITLNLALTLDLPVTLLVVWMYENLVTYLIAGVGTAGILRRA